MLTGYKTLIATVGYVVCEWLRLLYPDLGPALTQVEQGILIPLGVFGIASKIDRVGTGIQR